MHLRLVGGVGRGANSPREAVGMRVLSAGSTKIGLPLQQYDTPRGSYHAARRERDGAAAAGGSMSPKMAPGRFHFFLLAAIATAAHDSPRIGAEERGLVTRLNRRYRGGLCFKAFIRWPKLGRERARGRAEIDFHAIDAASAHWLLPHRFASARSKSG